MKISRHGARPLPRFAPGLGRRGVASTDGVCPADLDHAEPIGRLFAETYGGANHPMSDPLEFQRSHLAGDIWMVAHHDGGVVGCIAMRDVGWDGVLELGCLVLASGHTGRGLAGRLHGEVLAEAVRNADFEVVLCQYRSKKSASMGTSHEMLPVHVTGHDGGIIAIDGESEVHLMSVGANPERQIRRSSLPASHPLHAFAAEVPWLATTRPIEAARPDQFIVSPADPGAIQPGRPGVDGHGPDVDTVLVPPIQAATTLAALRQLARATEAVRAARVVTAFALADKVDLVRSSRDLGYRPTAWLPAWWTDGHQRHDCVMLTRSDGLAQGDPHVLDLGMAWERQLTEMLQPEQVGG
ncbi:MAG: hypothetical protein JWN46_1429 [Acidimicrobiales bacterium]|nr:hypothetical protein [Acidimicrobiales bacterium]